MTNHFTDLGFEVAEAEDLTELLTQLSGGSDEFALDSGAALLRWGVGAGIELWVQVHPSGEIVGVHPFFLGPSRTFFLVESVEVSLSEAMDAALMGWVSPSERPGEPGEEDPGAYPMRFDLPQYPLNVEFAEPGTVCELQVAAFADEIALYASEEEFLAAQDEDAPFAVKSFVPLGLIPPDTLEDDGETREEAGRINLLQAVSESDFEPRAEALFSGVISRCEQRVNPFSQRPFWWMQVSTWGAEYDCIADPDLLSRAPQTDDIVQGHFWMAARVTEMSPDGI